MNLTHGRVQISELSIDPLLYGGCGSSRGVLCCTVNIQEQVLHWDGWPQHVIYHFSLSIKDKALGHVILSGFASVPLPLNIRG